MSDVLQRRTAVSPTVLPSTTSTKTNSSDPAISNHSTTSVDHPEEPETGTTASRAAGGSWAGSQVSNFRALTSLSTSSATSSSPSSSSFYSSSSSAPTSGGTTTTHVADGVMSASQTTTSITNTSSAVTTVQSYRPSVTSLSQLPTRVAVEPLTSSTAGATDKTSSARLIWTLTTSQRLTTVPTTVLPFFAGENSAAWHI